MCEREKEIGKHERQKRYRKGKLAYLTEGTKNVRDVWDTVTVQLDSIA